MAALRTPPVLHPKQRGPGGGYVWLTIKLKDFIFQQQRHSTLFVVDRKHTNLNITQLNEPLKLIKLKMSAKAEGQHVSGSLQDEVALPHSFFYATTRQPCTSLQAHNKSLSGSLHQNDRTLGLGRTNTNRLGSDDTLNFTIPIKLFAVFVVNMMIVHRLTREMIASSNSQAARGVSTEGGDEMINCSQDYWSLSKYSNFDLFWYICPSSEKLFLEMER